MENNDNTLKPLNENISVVNKITLYQSFNKGILQRVHKPLISRAISRFDLNDSFNTETGPQ